MAKHLLAFLAVVMFCGLLVSLSQRRPATVQQSGAAPAKAPAKPAPKPKPKPKSQLPSPAEEKELLGFLKKSRRDFHAGLMAQKKTSDKRYRGTLKFAWQWYKRYKDLDKAVRSEVDREQKTRIEISKILGRIKKASKDADRKKLTSQLERLVGVQFDAQMKITRYKLDQMSNQLSRLRKELSNRQAERKTIVAQRVQEWLKATIKPVKPKPAAKK
ncbi:MAG: hypothetical protein QGH94_03125 [Phycisphaerae bacterium]|jgi:hypothetical protein|nr:hypothetical protein [Phycisphaerae bacterium]